MKNKGLKVLPVEGTKGGTIIGKVGGGRAIRFSKILSDFCSRGLNHLILYLKRHGKSIRP